VTIKNEFNFTTTTTSATENTYLPTNIPKYLPTYQSRLPTTNHTKPSKTTPFTFQPTQSFIVHRRRLLNCTTIIHNQLQTPSPPPPPPPPPPITPAIAAIIPLTPNTAEWMLLFSSLRRGLL
jgi:hypothetical protein